MSAPANVVKSPPAGKFAGASKSASVHSFTVVGVTVPVSAPASGVVSSGVSVPASFVPVPFVFVGVFVSSSLHAIAAMESPRKSGARTREFIIPA